MVIFYHHAIGPQLLRLQKTDQQQQAVESNRVSLRVRFLNICTVHRTATSEIVQVFLWQGKFFKIVIMLSFRSVTAAKCETLDW